MEPLSSKECVEKLNSLLVSIRTKTSADTSFVLHLDEAQSWSVPFEFTRKHGDELVPAFDYRHYFFIALTEVLEELRAHFRCLKIVITGTDVFLDRIIQLSNVSICYVFISLFCCFCCF